MNEINVRIPVPGEWWQYKTEVNQSPWPTDFAPVSDFLKIEILDVKDDWVRYKGTLNKDGRMKMKSFLNGFEIAEPPIVNPFNSINVIEPSINDIEPNVNATELIANSISLQSAKYIALFALIIGVISGVIFCWTTKI